MVTINEMPSTPSECRKLFRSGDWTSITNGICVGYTNANLVIVPKSMAFDFLLFCQRNPKPCPLLEVLEPGDPIVRKLADQADIRTDIPRYRVFVKGECVDEPHDVLEYWRDDLVTFLFGCSGTFEGALKQAGIRTRWLEPPNAPPIFVSNIPTNPAGMLSGPMVVSMRPMPPNEVPRAVQVSSRFPNHHGAPIHIGDPAAIGIQDVNKPDWVGPCVVQEDEIPVFWACGVTPQTVALESKPDLMITHYPAHMFLSDIPSEQQAII